MAYNVVTNSRLIAEFKKSKYFRTNLGIVNTVEKNGNRLLNDKDKFAHFYNTIIIMKSSYLILIGLW